MSATPHAMMPEATHDEAARFAHVVGLKNFLMRRAAIGAARAVDLG